MPNWSPAPSLVLSSATAPLLRAPALSLAAEAARLAGLDLDLAGRSLPALGRAGATPPHGPQSTPVSAIWLPLRRRPWRFETRADALLDAWVTMVMESAAPTVVIDRDAAFRPAGPTSTRPLLLRLADALPTGTRVAVVLRPEGLEPTRAHLDGLTVLRRTAEEWDFDIAVDLLGATDPRWEAELAIRRLLPRLTLVRLPSVAEQPGTSRRGRVTSRVLAYLLDQSFSGEISLAPRVAPLDHFRAGAVAARASEEAAIIAARHHRIFAGAPPPGPARGISARSKADRTTTDGPR